MTGVTRHFSFGTSIRVMLLFAFLCFGASRLAAETVEETFNNANKLYEQQKYSAAAAEYEKIVHSGNVGASVFYNLGNAYFKAGQTGRAIAAYRKAQQIAPRDSEVQANLQFARREADSKAGEGLWLQWIRRFTLNEWAIVTAVIVWIFFGLLTAGQWRVELRKSLRTWAIAASLLLVFVAICLGFAVQDRLFNPSAVVAVQEAVARRGPFDESQSYFTLRDGAEVRVLDRKEKWLQIADVSQRIGWLPEAQVVVINDAR